MFFTWLVLKLKVDDPLDATAGNTFFTLCSLFLYRYNIVVIMNNIIIHPFQSRNTARTAFIYRLEEKYFRGNLGQGQGPNNL